MANQLTLVTTISANCGKTAFIALLFRTSLDYSVLLSIEYNSAKNCLERSSFVIRVVAALALLLPVRGPADSSMDYSTGSSTRTSELA